MREQSKMGEKKVLEVKDGVSFFFFLLFHKSQKSASVWEFNPEWIKKKNRVLTRLVKCPVGESFCLKKKSKESIKKKKERVDP